MGAVSVRRSLFFLLGGLVVSLMLAGPVRAEMEVEVDVMATAQSLTSEVGGRAGGESPGFGTPRANVHLYGSIARRWDAYVEFHLNPINVPSGSEVLVDESHLVWSYGDGLHLKVGRFELDFGHRHRLRTDNARTDVNAFVTNGLIDPHAVQTGVEASGRLADRELAWSAALTNGLGDDGSPFDEQSEFASVGKVWGYPIENLSVAASHYWVDQSKTTGSSNLFADTRFAAIEGLHPGTTPPSVPVGRDLVTGEALGAGQKVTAWQLDLNYHLTGDLETLRAWVGHLEDQNVNGPAAGEPTTESTYVGLEGRTALSSTTYGAARWERLLPDRVAGSSVSGEPEMVSLAAGTRPTPNTLLKVEWLHMDRDGLSGADVTVQGGILSFSGRF